MKLPTMLIRGKVSAFTAIELLVVVTVISILSSLTILRLMESRKIARDTRRINDVRTYASAFQNYRLTHANFFIDAGISGQPCTLTVQNDPSVQGQRTLCTGASGRSYGMLNLHSRAGQTQVQAGAIPRSYADLSIADGLRKAGYLTDDVRDPSSKDTVGTNPNQPDYAFIRCCLDGTQNFGTGGAIFAVWASLERTPSTTDDTNTTRYCGGELSRPNNNPNYTYDFAAPVDQFVDRVFSAGNSVPKTTQSSSGVTACS